MCYFLFFAGFGSFLWFKSQHEKDGTSPPKFFFMFFSKIDSPLSVDLPEGEDLCKFYNWSHFVEKPNLEKPHLDSHSMNRCQNAIVPF